MSKLDLAATFPSTTKDDWTKQVKATLNRGKTTSYGAERLVTKTLDGIEIAPIYETPLQASARPRSPINHSSSYWDIVQRVDIPDNSKANEQMLTDLLKGATGISLVLSGSVNAGHYGLPSHDVVDFKQLSQGVELDLISVRLDAGSNWQSAAQNLLQVYIDRNLDLSQCAVTFGADPISTFAMTGRAPTKPAIGHDMAALFNSATKAGHTGVVFSADGRAYHDAGASEAQELGFAIAGTIEHLRLLEQNGVDLTSIWPRLGMILSADCEQFSTIAKFRAAHLLWAQLQVAMKVEPRALQLDGETSGRMMSVQDPYVNMLRTTSATFAAGIGGISSLAVLPFSSAIGSPDAKARRMARNAQLVLQEESSIGLVGDAGAGSGYIESFTNELAQKAWAIMQEIEANGGMMASLVDGKVQEMISSIKNQRDDDIAYGKSGLIGVTSFPTLEEPSLTMLDVKPVERPTLKRTSSDSLVCTKLVQAPSSAPFEALRKKVASKNIPTIQLLNWGTEPGFTLRATKMKNFFAIAGIKTTTDETHSGVGCFCSPSIKTVDDVNDAVSMAHDPRCEKLFVDCRPRGSTGSRNHHFLDPEGNILAELERVIRLMGRYQ